MLLFKCSAALILQTYKWKVEAMLGSGLRSQLKIGRACVLPDSLGLGTYFLVAFQSHSLEREREMKCDINVFKRPK